MLESTRFLLDELEADSFRTPPQQPFANASLINKVTAEAGGQQGAVDRTNPSEPNGSNLFRALLHHIVLLSARVAELERR